MLIPYILVYLITGDIKAVKDVMKKASKKPITTKSIIMSFSLVLSFNYFFSYGIS